MLAESGDSFMIGSGTSEADADAIVRMGFVSAILGRAPRARLQRGPERVQPRLRPSETCE